MIPAAARCVLRKNVRVFIRELEIADLKLFRDLKLSFVKDDGSPRMWTVIVGENGLGKTSLLRAIALAAVGPERGNQLADVASLPDRRRPTAKPTVAATLSVLRGGAEVELRSRVEVPPGINLLRGDSRWFNLRDQAVDLPADPIRTAQAMRDPGPDWFVAGYGVSRQLPLPGAGPEPSDRLLGRLEPLFDKGAMVATGFADQLEPELSRGYAKLLQAALVGSGLLPNVTKLVLTGKGGVSRSKTLVEANRFTVRVGNQYIPMPATWLSQGYQAMIAWIADLIGQQVLVHDAAVPLAQMQGLVLVDELDLFVHPTWQLKLVPILKKAFPRIQFVVTTHSPMVLPGLGRDEVLILEPDQAGNIVANVPPASPQLLTGSEIYDLFFGVHELYPTEAARALRQFALLAGDPHRDDEEEAQVQTARAALEEAGVDVDPPVPRAVSS